ncbi:unnamed protein product [Mesocestoides corti]|uniref:Transposase n=1 Tax=Mesocestoides corti TaxID=53468 RepID=A0A0R3UBI8_MESCO|nr:unnamed protein product [Mesocestoides corti]
MRATRGDALGVLQWQNSPRPGSVDFNNLKAAERQAASAQKNHIRENIRRVRSLTVTNGQQNPIRRGIGLPGTKMNIFERYLADLDNAAGQPQEISPDDPTNIPEDHKV